MIERETGADAERYVLISMERRCEASFAMSVADECGLTGLWIPDGRTAVAAVAKAPPSFAAAVLGADDPEAAARLASALLAEAPDIAVLFLSRGPSRPEWRSMGLFGQLVSSLSPMVLESALSERRG